MALYVAICLLGVLTAVAERADAGHVSVFTLVWGTTVGLALAHWFAFRLSARLVAGGTGTVRSGIYAATILVVAIAIVKNILSGH